MKKVIFAVLLVACFVPVAMAVDHPQPATVGEYSGLSQVRTDRLHSNPVVTRCANVTGYYYYSGSFDTNSQWANALSNENDVLVANSQVYQPFSVVATGTKKHLNVTGLCINSLDTAAAGIDNPTPYEVRFGAKVGSGGTVVCKGTAVSSDDPTGRDPFGPPEYTHAVKISGCKLAGSAKPGTQYHINVTPQCFLGSVCPSARYFESSDDSNLNHLGRPTNSGNALWNWPAGSIMWVNPNVMFGGKYFLSFSVGVTGRLVK